MVIKNMRKKIFEGGKLIYSVPSIDERRNFVRNQIDKVIWDEEKRFIMPHIHYLDFSKSLYDLKLKLIKDNRYAK